ncbi:uncharacterized protein [Oscarella lobularis]|uniref:uncharacterized protein n=1 Tax=Oscarella lobularis TaxID=121494 RepID=UPI0033140A5F
MAQLSSLGVLLFAGFVLFPRAAEAQPEGTCAVTEACVCKFNNDYSIDLRPLNSEGSPRFPISFGGYKYDVNLCSLFSIGACSDVTVCQSTTDGVWTYRVAELENAYFSTERDDIYYNMINGDEGRTARILLSCSEDEEGELTASGDGGSLSYQFTLNSKHACPFQGSAPGGPGGSSALSPGSILLIIVFSLLIAYFVVGIMIMKFKMNAEGKEIIPQSAFWTAIPGLIKDGALFICGRRGGNADVKYDAL